MWVLALTAVTAGWLFTRALQPLKAKLGGLFPVAIGEWPAKWLTSTQQAFFPHPKSQKNPPLGSQATILGLLGYPPPLDFHVVGRDFYLTPKVIQHYECYPLAYCFSKSQKFNPWQPYCFLSNPSHYAHHIPFYI